jgi:hypothetical protein
MKYETAFTERQPNHILQRGISNPLLKNNAFASFEVNEA